MKKLFIIVLTLLFCKVGFALSQKEVIDKHLSGRTLDALEGIWSLLESGQTIAMFKSGNTYQFYDLSNPRYDPGRVEKGADNYYYGKGAVFYNKNFNNPTFGDKIITLSGNTGLTTLILPNGKQHSWTMKKIWPTDSDRTRKFAELKTFCERELNFKIGTSQNSECAITIYETEKELNVSGVTSNNSNDTLARQMRLNNSLQLMQQDLKMMNPSQPQIRQLNCMYNAFGWSCQ
jgi:hypothetical protein